MSNWNKKYSFSKFKKKLEKNKSNNIAALSLALSLGLSMTPWALTQAEAAIVRADNGTTITNGNVHNIYAGNVNGTVATNRFSKFDLPEKQIANMYFKTDASSINEASKLFNFVDERISVSGTVNAIKANKIGGDMYFLSPNGMIVSNTGVINVGSLTVMAGGKYPTSDAQALNYAQQVDKAEYKLDENKSANITIAGQVNAYGNIIMESNKEVLVLTGAKLKTQEKMDFSNLVNIEGIDSGLNTKGDNLVISREDENGGNIILRAATWDNNEQSTIGGWITTLTNNTASVTVDVQENSTIEADGTVSIGAHAIRNPKFGNLATFGNVAQTKATVKVNGDITANNIAITADAENKYSISLLEKGAFTIRQMGTEFAQRYFSDNMDSLLDLEIDFIGMKSISDVEIGSKADLKALGTDSGDTSALQINSQSSLNILDDKVVADSSAVSNKKLLASGMLFSYVENDANIAVKDGAKLQTVGSKDAGSVAVNATAATDVSTISCVELSNKSASYTAEVATAITYGLGHTNSLVDFQNASIESAKNVNINAATKSKGSSDAFVISSQDVKGSTAILYYGLDSDAKVNVAGDVTAEEELKIAAVNNESIKTRAKNFINPNAETTWVQGLINPGSGNFTNLAYKIINKIKKNAKAEHVAGAFTFGASLDVVDVKNTSSVNFANTAKISGESVDVKAEQGYDCFRIEALGASSEVKSNKNISAAAAVVWQEDSATVNIAGSKDDNAAKITATNSDLSITAESKYEWNRLDNLLNGIKNCISLITLDDIRAASKAGAEVPQALVEYAENPTDAKKEEICQAIRNDPNWISWIGALWRERKAFAMLYQSVLNFGDAGQYVNINAGTLVRPGAQDASGLSFAGSAIYADFDRKADVVVGSGSELKAKEKLLINAEAKQVDVNYAGKTQGLLGTFGGKMGISDKITKLLKKNSLDVSVLPGWSNGAGDVWGGNAGYYDNKLQSGVVVAESAKLEADQIKLNATTDMQRILVSIGGGVAGETGITGMFTINKGITSSIVAVDDEATLKATNEQDSKEGISIKADNDSTIINVDGNVTAGAGSAVGVGIGYDKNEVNTLSGVRDIDKEILDSASQDEKLSDNDKKYYASVNELLNTNQKNYMGSSEVLVSDASISTPKLDIEATSTPIIWNIAASGAIATKKGDPQPPQPVPPQPQEGNLNNAQAVVDEDEDLGLALNNLFDEEANNNAVVGAVNGGEQGLTHAKLMASGAVNINQLEGVTQALLEDTTVNLTDGNRYVALNAYEDGMTVGISGALSYKDKDATSKSTEAMIAGTASVNLVDMDVLSAFNRTTIKDALAVTNKAKQAEKIVATAAPIVLNQSYSQDQIKGFEAAVNASVNKVENSIEADLEDTEVGFETSDGSNTTRVQNYAYDESTQITGGLQVDEAKNTAGVGINVVWARLKNDVKAHVSGGKYENIDIDQFENIAASNLTQVNVAVGLGVGSGNNNKVTVGALWSNAILDNDTSAIIDNGAAITANSLTNQAIDGTIDGETTDDTWTTKEGTTTTKTELLKEFGMDADGSSIKKNISSTEVLTEVDTKEVEKKAKAAGDYTIDTTLDKDATTTSNYTNSKLTFNTDKKTLIINGGLLIEGSTASGKGGGGIAIADSLVDNDYKAQIKDANITIKDSETALKNIAKSESEIYSVAAGVSLMTEPSNFLNAAGSAAANKLRNDTISIIEDSSINAAKLEVEAKNQAKMVAVAGAIEGGRAKGGVGIAVAVNDMGNTTTAKILSSAINALENGATEIKIHAKNDADIYAVGAGISVSGEASTLHGQGNVAVNVGYNNTEAAVDGTEEEPSSLSDVAKLDILAENTSYQAASAAGLRAENGKVGIGLGFAVNKISDQTMAARLNNVTVTTKDKAVIDVKTNENTTLGTVGIGLSISGANNKFAFEGAGAITLAKNKNNVAEAINANISKADDESTGAEVQIEAKETNKIVSNADSISLGFKQGQGVVGLGASVIDLKSNTKATISNSIITAEDILLNAEGHQTMYNIGAGAGGGASSLAGAGSLTFNYLTNNVSTLVEKSTLKANNNIGITAKGEDKLVNFSGGIDITVGGTIGVGLAVAYNELAGDITATVEDSEIEALGKGSTSKANKAHSYTTNNTNKMSINSDEEHQGLLVDAYGNHNVTDVALTLGVVAGAGYDGAGVGLDGLGSHTILGGKTGAYLKNTNVNKDATKVSGDVVVTAVDDTSLHDVDVNLSVACGQMGGISGGITVAMADLERTIEARVDGNKAGATDDKKRNTVNGNELQIQAGGKSDTNLVTVGTGIGGSSVGAGAVGALADAITDKKTIKATLTNVNSTNNGTILTAANDATLNYKGIGVLVGGASGFGGALGFAVGSMSETNTIGAVVENAAITHDKATSEDIFAVTNSSKATPNLVAVEVGGGEAGAAIGVAIDSHSHSDKLSLDVINAQIGSKDLQAASAEFKVNNYIDIDRASVNVALAAALYGGALGGNVQPTTINSAEVLNIADSTVYAKEIELETAEYHKLSLDAINVVAGTFAGIGVTRSYTTLGGQLMNTYSTQNNGKFDSDYSENLDETISKSNEAIAQGQKKVTEGVKGALDQLKKGAKEVVLDGDTSTDSKEATKKDHNITTGKVQDEGLKINSSLSTYKADSMTVKSTVTDAIDLYSGSGSVGIAGININAVRVDQHLKNTINIEGGKITADDLSVLGTVTGDTYVHTTAAIIGGVAVNVAYADVYADGELGDKSGNSITLDGVDVETNNSLLVRALDDAKYRSYASGGGLEVLGGGYIEAESKEELDNTVTIKNSSLTNKAVLTESDVTVNSADKKATKAAAGAMEIVSMKSSFAEAKTKYGTVTGLGGLANSTTASIKSNSDIILKDNKTIKDASVVMDDEEIIDNQAGVLDIYALYNAHSMVDMTYGAGDVLGAGGGVYGHASSEGQATINAENNAFDLVKLNAHSEVKDNHNGDQDKYNLAETHTKAINVLLGVGVDVNEAEATIKTVSNTNFKNNRFAYNTINKPVDILGYRDVEKGDVKTYEPIYKYEEVKEGKALVDLKSDTSTKAVADIYGVTAGLVLAIGHNSGTVNVTESTLATMDNSGLMKDGKLEATYLDDLNIYSNGTNVVDNLAEGSGGAALAISPKAFSATNNLEITNKATLKGEYFIKEDLMVTASQKDELEIKGTSKGAGVVDAAGGNVTNNRSFSTSEGEEDVNKTTVVIDGAKITANTAHISASNDMSLNKHNGFGVEGGAVSILFADSTTKFTNNLDEAAQVKIAGSSITTEGNLDINASTLNDVFVKSSFSNGGALFGNDGVKTESKFNYSNDISIDAASKLKTDSGIGDIVISSVDDTILQVGSYAYAYGLVESIATPNTNNTTNRNNTINVAGELFSSNDLKMYSGQYANLSNAGLDAVVDIEAYASSIIPSILSSEIHNSISENNIVKLDKSAKASSVGNIDIYANEGDVSIVVNDRSSHGYWSNQSTQEYYTYVTTKNHTAKDALHSNDFHQNNQVIIDGTATAGTVNKVDMIIGKVGEFIVLNDKDREAYNASNSEKALAKPSISYGDNSVEFSDNELSYKSVNLSLNLIQEYNEAQQVAAQYSAEPTSEAYMVAKSRIAAIEDQMVKLGIVQLDEKGDLFRDRDGRVVPTETVRTDAIVLPDITVSGGDISINTQDLVSSQGTIKAYGSPEVNIINKSNLYLLLDDVFVGEHGGEIFYTNNSGHKTSIDNALDLTGKNKLINDLNAKVKNTNFTAIDTDAGTGSGEINIQGAYNGPQTYTVNPHLTDSESADRTYTYKVLADIELGKGKEIVNSRGKVIVNSANNNLYINGNVVGRDIILTAPNGSLYQNSISSAIDIGGDVKQLYDELVKGHINPTNPENPNGAKWSGSNNHYTFNLDSSESASTDMQSGRIMGDNIYITAESINVNGLIQSGYEKYTYTATEADISAMATLDEKYRNQSYSDDNIIAMGKDSAFCIKQGGMIWNETKGYYDYDVPVYYNPSTHKILIPSIVSHAGNIYLTGKVASTGNGRLVAMDGTYNITLDTSISNNDLKLYGLETTDNVGKITIVDTQRHTASVITRDGYEVTPLTGDWDTPTTVGVVTNSTKKGFAYTYNPLENQRYSWTMGMDSAERTYWERKFEANWWGLRNSEDVTKDVGNATRVGDITLNNQAKDSANNIGILEGTNYGNFHITADKVTTENAKSDPTITRWETGFWGFRKHELYKWHVDSGNSFQYNISVNASQPIDIKFIGNAERNSDVKVTAGGSIDVHGNVGNKDFLNQENIKSSVEINSINGGIFQGKGTIVGNQVVLKAAGSMKGIAIEGNNKVTLTAENTATQESDYYREGICNPEFDIDIELNVQVKDGGEVNLYGASGNLTGDTTMVDSFSLTTNGNISQMNAAGKGDAVITASRVDLVSTDGAIGAETAPIKVNTGDTPLIATDSMSASLNAKAKSYIYLAETTGDMRVGHISSETGDVVLEGPGSLVDALPYAENTRGRSDEALMEHWNSLGLFEDREYMDADGNMQKALRFDPQRLLYSIADEKINPVGIATSNKSANIKARNLILKMGDSAGLNGENTTEYKISELGTTEDIKDLKDLARADASSVEWNDKEDKVTIREKLPIGVELAGNLTVEGFGETAPLGNVYLEARRENLDGTKDVDLNIKDVKAIGDVLLRNSLGSIYSVAEDGKAAISARNLDIGAGQSGTDNAFVGTPDNYMPININGTLRAVGTGGVYIKQVSETSPLTISNVYSNGDVYLESIKDIVSTNEGNTRSYINWGEGKTLSLTSTDGNVGTAEQAIRLMNEQDLAEGENPEDKRKIKIKAKENAYIEGVSLDVASENPMPSGTLFLNDFEFDGSLNVKDNGNIYIVKAEAATINLEAKGSILEAENGELVTDNLIAQAATGIDLVGENNQLHNVALYNEGTKDATDFEVNLLNDGKDDLVITAIGKAKDNASEALVGNVTIVNNNSTESSENKIVLDGNANVGGNLKVIDYASGIKGETGSNVTCGGSAEFVSVNAGINNKATITTTNELLFKAATNIVNQGDLTAGTNVILNSKGNISNDNAITAQDGFVEIVSTEAGITNSETADITSFKGDITLQSKQELLNGAAIHAKYGDINLVAGDSIEDELAIIGNSGALSADGNIIMQAFGQDLSKHNTAVTNSGKLTASSRILLYSENASIENRGEISGYVLDGTDTPTVLKDVEMIAADNIHNGIDASDNQTTVTAKSVLLLASDGDVENYMNVVTTTSDANIVAGSAVINRGNMISEGDSAVISAGSFVENYGEMQASEAVNITSGDYIYNVGDIVVVKNNNPDAENGTFLSAETYIANAGNILVQNQGDIKIEANDDIDNIGMIEIDNGSVTIASKNGNIINGMNGHAEKGDIFAWNGDVIINAGGTPNGTTFIAENGKEFRNGSVINYGDIVAMKSMEEGSLGTITLKSENAEVFNFNDFNTLAGNEDYAGYAISAGNLNINAEKGEVYNTKNIISNGEVNITAQTGLSNFAFEVYAAEDINLTATDGNLFNNTTLISEFGDVNLMAPNGTVVNLLGGDIFALGGSVSMISGASKTDSEGNLKPDANTIYAVDSGYVYEDASGRHYSESTGKTTTLMDLLPEGTEIAWPGDIDDRIVTLDKYYRVNGTGEVKLIDQNVVVNALNKAEQESIYAVINVVDDKGTPVRLRDTQGNELIVQGNIDVYRLGDAINRGDMVALGTTKENASGELESVKPGTIHLRSEHGNVANYDNFAMIDGKTTMEEKYEYALNGKKYNLAKSGIAMEAPEGYFYNSMGYFTDGDLIIEAKKSLTIGDNFSIGDVGGDIRVTSKEGTVTNISEVLTAGNSVVLTGKTGVTNEGLVVGREGNVEFNTEKGDVLNNAEVQAGKDIKMNAEEGFVNNTADLFAGNDVNLNGNAGVSNIGVITADENIIIKSAEGSVETEGDLTSENGYVQLDAADVVDNKGDIDAGKFVEFNGTNGVSNTGEVNANENVTMKSEAGNVANEGNLTAETGDVKLDAATTVSSTSDQIKAGGKVDITGIKGVSVDSTVVGGEDVNVYSKEGSVELKKDVTSTDSKIFVEGTSVTTDGNINAKDHILMEASQGNLDIKGNVENSEGGIELYAKDGHIDISQNVTAGDTGLLRIYAEQQDPSADGVNARGELKSINGSIDVGTKNGNIDIASADAKETVAIGTDNGNVLLGTVSGDTVVLYNSDSNDTVKADKITVDKHLVVQSSKPDIEHVEAAPGAQQITVDVTGVSGVVDPSGRINIGGETEKADYKLGVLAIGIANVRTGGNISVENLYVNGDSTSKLIADKGIAIDSLAVKEKLFASGYGYDTSVFGTTPEYDNSNAIYYDDSIATVKPGEVDLSLDNVFFGKDDKQPVLDELAKQIENLKPAPSSDKNKGMNLYITGSHNQDSNGKLLHNDNYYYVKYQRYSAEDLSRILTDYKADATYDDFYEDNIGLFARYNLYELPAYEIVNGQLTNTFVEIVLAKPTKENK